MCRPGLAAGAQPTAAARLDRARRPRADADDRASRARNVHLLGPRPHELIPDYIAAFDVCLIPYVVDDFTSNISPAKLNEYMALGKQVVSTALAEVRRFNEAHGAVVRIGATREEFIDQVQGALESDTRTQRDERRSVAERNSWGRRVEAMSRLIDARLCRAPQSTAQ